MKIGLAGSSLNNRDILSGSAVTILGLINALKEDNDLIWLSSEPELKEEEFSPVPIEYFTKNSVREVIKKLDLDVVILEVWASNINLLAKELSEEGVKVVMWDDNSPYALDRWRGVVQYADIILTHGEGGKMVLEEEYQHKEIHTFFFASDPKRFSPIKSKSFECDISFLGSNLKERIKPLEYLFFEQSEIFPNKKFDLYGAGWEDSELLDKYQNINYRGWANNDDIAKIYHNSKITINGTRAGLNETYLVPSNRIFDTLSSGAVLLSDPIPGIDHIFTIGEELFIAQDKTEATKIINLLLSDVSKRREVSKNARKAILDSHTWEHRKEQLLELL
jgi:spore maturation protein CgeB